MLVPLVVVHMGISLGGFGAAISRGPRIASGDMGMQVPEWVVPAGGKAAATGWRAPTDGARSGALHARERLREVPREPPVRPTNGRGVSMTERASPSIAAVGRDIEQGAAPSKGGAVRWAG